MCERAVLTRMRPNQASNFWGSRSRRRLRQAETNASWTTSSASAGLSTMARARRRDWGSREATSSSKAATSPRLARRTSSDAGAGSTLALKVWAKNIVDSVSRDRRGPLHDTTQHRAARLGPARRLFALFRELLDSLPHDPERGPVGAGDEDGVVAGDRARDLGPAGAVERGRNRVGRTRQRLHDEQQAGLSDLDREVRKELAEAVVAGRLGLDQARRQRVGLDPLAAGLHEPQLRDIAADRRLGRPESSFPERGCQLLLRPDRALVDEVADCPLAGLLHDLHRLGPTGGRRRARPPRGRSGRRR